MLNDSVIRLFNDCQMNTRKLVANAVIFGLPVPAISSALSYYDSIRCEVLPANLLQAQRDYFGAHTFSVKDRPENEKYHVSWQAKQREIKIV